MLTRVSAEGRVEEVGTILPHANQSFLGGIGLDHTKAVDSLLRASIARRLWMRTLYYRKALVGCALLEVSPCTKRNSLVVLL